tara:strand:+ start:395 stop:2581 length:2187 start_codon:yes stop_codon:yes gene_type:complete
MKKSLFLFLSLFIFFCCKESSSKRKDLNPWLISILERDLEPNVDIRNQEIFSNTLPLKQRVDDTDAWLKPGDSGIQLFHNNKIGLGVLKNSKGIHLVSLFDISRGIELLNNTNTSIFRIHLSSGKDTIRIDNESSWNSTKIQWNTDSKYPSLSLHFTNPLHHKLKGFSVVCQVEFHNNFTHWTLETIVPEKGLSLLESEFPSIYAGPIGKVAEENVLHYPKASGIATPLSYTKSINYSEVYPSWKATYQMLGLYDQQGGLYIASHDPTGSIKTISTSADAEKVNFRFNWPAPNMSLDGNGYKLPGKIVLGSITGDWYEAAMTYQAWVKAQAPWWPPVPTERPSRIQDISVWVKHEGGDPATLVQEVLKFAEYMGVPIGFHWYRWHQIPFDNDYPHYFPAKDGFVEAVRKLEDAGIRVMPYINGRLWDADLDDFKSEGIKAVTKNEKGEPYIEDYGNGVRNAVMNPTTQIWQHKMKEIVLRLQQDAGTSGVYLDQISAASPKLCMDITHEHPLGGGSWWLDQGYYKLLSAIRNEMPKGTFLTSESIAEPYNHLLDGLLSWNSQFQNQKPIYSAIYGGRISIFGRYNPVGPEKHKALIMRAGQQLVFGEQLGWISPNILKEKAPADFLRKMAQTRYKLNDYFVGGQMLAPPIIHGDIPNITADWEWWEKPSDVTISALQRGTWQANDGRVVKIFVNISNQNINFQIPDLKTSKINKISLDAYDLKIIEEP